MRTLILAERPFRDLCSRALLQELPAGLGQGQPLLLPTSAATCPGGYAPMPPEADPAAHGVSEALMLGIFQERLQLDRALAIATRAVAGGASLRVRALSLERSAARRDAPEDIAILDAAASIEVREHHTANVLTVWRVATPIRNTPYAERSIEPDFTLADTLPPGPLLGLSVRGGPRMREAWIARLAELRARLAPLRDWPVVPLPTESAESSSDDHAGTLEFLDLVLPGAVAHFPGFADPVWRRRHLTPPRLKGLVARCGLVMTSQDLPAAYAVAAGVKVIGLSFDTSDRRALTCLAALANDLPAGSEMLCPPVRG